LFPWPKRSPRADTIRSLYGVIVAQARTPAFYANYGVADTPAGRFDMIVLHLVLVVRRLRREPAPVRALGQGVFDLFCRDMDHNFREMGIGDLAVPKHMRRVAEAFYGRAAAYDEAIDRDEGQQLAAVLARHILPDGVIPSAWPPMCAPRSTNWSVRTPKALREPSSAFPIPRRLPRRYAGARRQPR
jgi:cytochrome b pre-mRNA-processing protein 3